ncbi:MAG: TetR/AcrR family transcriptional regulator [Saprospiraceae bacterium]|nr:TetR/AcrR family transcriptional regulator [Saprospiraceae bacterium]
MAVKEKDTEQKIKDAARTIFQEKGFAGARTRDIAEKAGINLALLNYYFRSKQKLYDIIMTETMQTFFGGVIKILNDEQTSIEEKIEAFVTHYIDLLSGNANIPHFILSNVREDPEGYLEKIGALQKAKHSFFFQQFIQASMEGKIPPINPIHFILNLIGLVVFPFLAKPMIAASTGISDQQYADMLEERKRLIPLWVNEMLKVK